MDINFYKNKSAPNIIPKALEYKFTAGATLKNNTSVMNPIITVNLAEYNLVIQSNYIYITKFKRYYYIDDITIVNALIEISMTCDVLESFKKDILNSTQIISRQEKKKNLSIIDNRLPMCSDVAITTHLPDKMGDTFTTNEGFFVLGTTGGVTNG